MQHPLISRTVVDNPLLLHSRHGSLRARAPSALQRYFSSASWKRTSGRELQTSIDTSACYFQRVAWNAFGQLPVYDENMSPEMVEMYLAKTLILTSIEDGGLKLQLVRRLMDLVSLQLV